jgi:hypothetical protein
MAAHKGKQALILGMCQSPLDVFRDLLLIYVQVQWDAARTVVHLVMLPRR